MALCQEGVTWELDRETQSKMTEINNRYEVDDPLYFDVVKTFTVEPDNKDLQLSTAEIIHTLRNNSAIVGGSDQQVAQRIANILQKLGCERTVARVNGHPTRVWKGVAMK